MEHGGLIYLDNAATSYPKPPEVYSEVVRSLIQEGGTAGRGAPRLSLAAAEKIYECRQMAAEFFGVSEPERVFFTLNTTYGLNTVIKGFLRRGDHALISDMEHNAVYRPIYKLAGEGKISYGIYRSFAGDPQRSSEKICDDIARKVRRNTRLVVCNHHSNICSLTMPISDIARLCHQCGARLLVDGAQSAGRERISVDEMGIDALCVPSHKGLYGPQGCGIVILGKGITLNTLAEGGNGVNSLEGDMPDFSPERYEAGTLPTPAIAGLCEGIRFLRDVGTDTVRQKETELFRQARDMLGSIAGVRLYLPECEGATLLFNIDGLSADSVGNLLNKQGICVRSGYHCAALGHKTLGTCEGGAVRASFGLFNDSRDVERLYATVKDICVGK